jgi:hypothetical protein
MMSWTPRRNFGSKQDFEEESAAEVCTFKRRARIRTLRHLSVLAVALLAVLTAAKGEESHDKFLIPDETVSPNGRYGVTVPVFDSEAFDKLPEPKNALIKMETKRILATIDATPGYNRSLNHRSTPIASWSRDSSLLLWKVDGKWFPNALMLLKVEKDQVLWQRNLLKLAQEAILARTRNATPRKYALAKKANEGNGSAYPEGFTVDAGVLEPILLPLHVRVTLTSNPKAIEGHPTLESHLDGMVDKQGKFVVKDFQLGPAP